MLLLWCCVITALMTTCSTAAVDVERTVQQVQSILQTNSQLPRLTRDEIIQLLNDIRAEDAKSTSASKENKKEYTTTEKYRNDVENEINPVTQLPDIKDNVFTGVEDFAISASAPTNSVYETTTKSNEPTVMVVLPYTPRDGSSLQELYTRPPRVKVVPVSKVTPKPIKTVQSNEKLHVTLNKNAQLAKENKINFPAELQAFLDAHGLKGNPGQDHFLLPLEGFKPLPPAKMVDGSVQLPENILLTYDLISPTSEQKPEKSNDKIPSLSQNNFMYEPLRPEMPFELDTSSSERKQTVLPLDLPTKTTKSNSKIPNYEPIDYDSVKVIPLQNGPSPIEDVKLSLENELNKRQTNTTANESSKTETKEETTTVSSDTKDAITNGPANANDVELDTGASMADLESSFGGAAPEEPGDSQLPPPKKNGFYWMLDWNSFLEVGDGDTKVNIRLEPKLGDPQMFLPVNVP